MKWIVSITVRLVRAGQRAYTKKWSFLAVFSLILLVTVVTLWQLNLLPETKTTGTAAPVAVANSLPQASTTPDIQLSVSELPVKISIPAISLEATISNPTSLNTEVLDGALLTGAVRYPSSAKLGEEGNMVIFGHSSYLPIVNNQAYKTFDGIQKLVQGSVITVYSADTAYTYRVRSVTKESATSDGIPLQVTGRVLTLSTCDSFGEKTDRFIVVADFVDSYSISN
jgi:LPXTG-site transpeptidase (sortase) family protein